MIALDLYLAYLRAAFHTCYYCVCTTDKLEELQRKCIKHVRKPLSKSQETEAVKEEDEKDAEKTEKDVERGKKDKLSDTKRNGKFSFFIIISRAWPSPCMQMNDG